MTVHAIKQTAARSRERQALAAAIEMAAQAERAEENALSAVSRAAALVAECELTVAAANTAFAAAKDRDATAVAEAVSSGSRATPASVRGARAAQVEATDGLDASRAALASLEAAATDRAADKASASMAVEAAINCIVAIAVPQLVAQLTEARDRMHSMLSAVAWCRARGRERVGQTSGFVEIRALAEPLAKVAHEIDSALLVGTGAWDSNTAVAHPTVGRWEEVVAKLRADADALLPD